MHEKPVNITLLMFNCSERLSFWNCYAAGQDAPGTWEGLSPQVSGWTDGRWGGYTGWPCWVEVKGRIPASPRATRQMST